MKHTFREEFTRIGLLRGILDAGLNDGQSGVLNREIEYTIYAKVSDFEFLKDAYQVDQIEQWKIPFASTEDKVRARIRQTNNRIWEITTKSDYGDYRSCNEVTTNITKVAYEQFKMAACDGYPKTRYFFRTNDPKIIIEVDVFVDKNTGKQHQWVKIDIEVADLDAKVPDLPFGISEFIVANNQQIKREEEVRIAMLWLKEWSRLDEKNIA